MSSINGPSSKDPEKQHLSLAEVNADVRDRIGAIIASNYVNSRYEDPPQEEHTRRIASEIREVLRDRAVKLDALDQNFYSENFTVEGIPFINEKDLDVLCQAFPYLKDLLQEIAARPTPSHATPLNIGFIGVNKAGRLRRLPSSTLSLRSREYFFNLPEDLLNQVKEQNSSLPIVGHIEDRLRFHQGAVESIQKDPSLKDKALSEKEVLALAVPFDHLKNYVLFLLNFLLILGKSKAYPDVLKGLPSNSYLQTNSGRKDITPNRTKIYLESIEALLASKNTIQLAQFIDEEYEEIFDSVKAFVKAYYGFLATKDVRYLMDFDLKQVDRVISTFLPHVAQVIEVFEAAVNNQVSPETESEAKDNSTVKREFFKKVLRHERDGDHPGVNLASVLSHINPDGSKAYDLVCGVAYGGIELPILYKAMQEVQSEVTGKQAEGSAPEYAHLLISNYNLAFNPAFTPRLEAHIFPQREGEGLEGKKVLILDDNIITGKTNTQIEVAFESKGANPTFAVDDLNMDPAIIDRETTMSVNLEPNASHAVRPIPKRNAKVAPYKRKRRSAPDFMNASRYF